MTELSHSPDDEIVSAVLDGEATAAEHARVDAEPELRRRMAELAQVRDQIAAPVALPDELTMRRLVDRAASEADSSDTAAGPVGRPAPLRADPPWWRRGVGIGLGSAAALVLLAFLVGPALVEGLGAGDDDDGASDVAATAADEDRDPNIVAESFDYSADGDDADSEQSDMDEGVPSAAGDDAWESTDEGRPDAQLYGSTEHDSVDSFAAAMRSRATDQLSGGGESSDLPPVTTTATDRLSVEPIDELFARCGPEALDDHRGPGAEVVVQAEGFVGDARLLGFAIDRIDDLVVVIFDDDTCEVVATG